MWKQFCLKQFNLALVRSLIVKTVLFQVIQFNRSKQFTSIWPIDRTLSGATTPGQSTPGSNSYDGVLCILQSSSITGISPSDCFLSYPEHSLWSLTPLQRSSRCILQHQTIGQLEVWGMHSTASRILHPGPLWVGWLCFLGSHRWIK